VAYVDEVLADAPLIYWRLNESAGPKAADSSGSAIHGTYSATGITYGAAPLVADGTAVTLNGNPGRITTGLPRLGDDGDLTVEMWVRTTQTGGNVSNGGLASAPCLASRSTSSSLKAWVISIHTTGAIAVQIGANYVTTRGNTVINDGLPHHVVVRIYAAQQAPDIYVDGVADTIVMSNSAAQSPTAPDITVGFHPRASASSLMGTIDEFAIYPDLLPVARIAAHHAAGAVAPIPSTSGAGVVGVAAGSGVSPTLSTNGPAVVGVSAGTGVTPVAVASGAGVIGVAAGAVASEVGVPVTSGGGVVGVSTGSGVEPVVPVETSGAGVVGVAGRGVASIVLPPDELEATSHTRVRTTLADSVDIDYLTAQSHTTVITSAALSLDVTINPSTKRPDYTLLLVDRYGWPIVELDKASLGTITRTRNGDGSFSFSLDKDDPKLAEVRQFSEVQVRIGNRLVPGGWFVITDPAIDNGREWKFQCAGLRWHLESRRIGKELPELLRNGDFTQGEKYWHAKWFKGSAAEAPPHTQIVTGDKAMEGGKALEVTGVESVSKQSIQSNAIFLANRPFAGEDLDNGFVSGGKKVITDAIKKISKGSAVTVEGHTADADAGDGYALSVRRAEAAKQVILAARPDLKVTAIGKGETDQVAPNNTEANQAKNRRLVIIATITSVGHRQAVTQRITYTQPKSARRPMELLLDARVNLIDYVGPSKDGWLLYIDRRKAAKPTEINDASHTTIAEDFPVERWTTDGTSINAPADGQPWIFEVRLYPTAGETRFDQVSLRPNIYTAWYGITRPEAIRNLVRHAQDTTFHKADLNITTNCRPFGPRSDFEYAWLDRRTVDDAISEELRSDTSPDFEIVVTDHRRIATTWSNRGRRTHVPLKLGDIVTDYSSGLDGDKVASTAIVQASRQRGSKAEAIVRTTRKDGLVLERLFDAEQGSTDTVVRAQARAALRYGRTDVIRSVTCDPDRTIWLMERIDLGDICPVQVDDGGLDGNGDYRIEAIALDPNRHQLTYQLAAEGA
jgi:hypothetical protein